MTLCFYNHIRFTFRKKKIETIAAHYNNCFKNFQNNFQNVQRFKNVLYFNIDFVDDELIKKNINTFTIVDNDQQRIRKLQNEIIQLRNETEISKLKIRTKQFRVEIDATTFVKLFFVITKNVNASQKKFMFDDDAMTKSIVIFHKLFKFNKLKNYKKFFKKKYRHWMRDAKLIFIKNFDYFSNDRTKILNINNVSNIRNFFLNVVIMQKKNLKR